MYVSITVLAIARYYFINWTRSSAVAEDRATLYRWKYSQPAAQVYENLHVNRV